MAFGNRRLSSFARKLLSAIGILIFFTVLSLYPNFSYFGEANIRVEDGDRLGFLWVRAFCNITYNPFIYTFSWLTGNGYYSGSFLFISKPTYYFSGTAPRIKHRTPEDLQQEAIEYAVYRERTINILFNFILFLVIGLVGIQDLYLSIIVGATSFSLGGLTGALAVFLPTLAIMAYIKLRSGEGVLVRTWNLLVEKYEEPRELDKF